MVFLPGQSNDYRSGHGAGGSSSWRDADDGHAQQCFLRLLGSDLCPWAEWLCRWWELFEGRHVCVGNILWGLAISVCGHRGGIAAIRGTDLTPEQPLLAFRMANVPGKFKMSFLSVSLSQGWYCIWLHIGIYRVYRWQLRRINKDRSVALSEDFEIRQSRCPVALSSGWSFPPFAFPRIFSLASIAYGLVITTFFTRAKTAATVGSIIFCTTSVLI